MKRDAIGLVCKACGNQSVVDLRHKLCTYIVRNPPQKDKKSKDKPSKNGTRGGHSSEEEANNNNEKHEATKENIKVILSIYLLVIESYMVFVIINSDLRQVFVNS